jgi:hypothetical protein|tara:strand:+ start:1796 stop:3571 length:1776 start_codon:yes stop_codon:yes gene_type:complete
MAEEQGRISRFLSAIGRPFRRRESPTPTMPLWSSGIQEPVMAQGITLPALFAVSNESLILRTVLSKLRQEMFRRGFYWEKRFTVKCTACDEEYQQEMEACKECGGAVRKPDPDELTYAKWLLKQENSMEQSFHHLLHEVENDLNIIDDAFLILVKEYFIDPESKEVQFYRVKEMVRGDPIFMRIVADKRGVRGGRYKTCLIHREQVKTHAEDDTCEICGSDLHDVHYVNMAGSGKTQYFVEGEVLHVSKYNPSKLYGRSPVNTMWRQAMTLTAMDNYIYTAYQKRRIPKGVISVTTDNLESMKAFWKATDEKLERDPHYIPRVGIESQSGRGGVNWIKFMDTLEEMQYIAVRDEIRNRIAAFYGVSSIFMVDNGKSGGLNNEGLQILVTNRAVEFGQKVYTEVLFPRLLRQMNINDWKLTLYPNEEEDEITRLRRDEQELNVAQRMAQLGFQPELLEDPSNRDVRFVYRKPPPAPPGGAPPPGGMPPQMMGGMPPQMMGGRGMPPQMMGGMPPQMGAMPPQSQQLPPGIAPPLQPGSEGRGIRNRGPVAPQRRGTMGSGSPISSIQQRGPEPSMMQNVSNALLNARRPRGR